MRLDYNAVGKKGSRFYDWSGITDIFYPDQVIDGIVPQLMLVPVDVAGDVFNLVPEYLRDPKREFDRVNALNSMICPADGSMPRFIFGFSHDPFGDNEIIDLQDPANRALAETFALTRNFAAPPPLKYSPIFRSANPVVRFVRGTTTHMAEIYLVSGLGFVQCLGPLAGPFAHGLVDFHHAEGDMGDKVLSGFTGAVFAHLTHGLHHLPSSSRSRFYPTPLLRQAGDWLAEFAIEGVLHAASHEVQHQVCHAVHAVDRYFDRHNHASSALHGANFLSAPAMGGGLYGVQYQLAGFWPSYSYGGVDARSNFQLPQSINSTQSMHVGSDQKYDGSVDFDNKADALFFTINADKKINQSDFSAEKLGAPRAHVGQIPASPPPVKNLREWQTPQIPAVGPVQPGFDFTLSSAAGLAIVMKFTVTNPALYIPTLVVGAALIGTLKLWASHCEHEALRTNKRLEEVRDHATEIFGGIDSKNRPGDNKVARVIAEYNEACLIEDPKKRADAMREISVKAKNVRGFIQGKRHEDTDYFKRLLPNSHQRKQYQQYLDGKRGTCPTLSNEHDEARLAMERTHKIYAQADENLKQLQLNATINASSKSELQQLKNDQAYAAKLPEIDLAICYFEIADAFEQHDYLQVLEKSKQLPVDSADRIRNEKTAHHILANQHLVVAQSKSSEILRLESEIKNAEKNKLSVVDLQSQLAAANMAQNAALDASVENFQQVLMRDPQQTEIAETIAGIYLQQGKHQEAIEHVSGTSAVKTEFKSMIIGVAELRRGNQSQGREALENLLQQPQLAKNLAQFSHVELAASYASEACAAKHGYEAGFIARKNDLDAVENMGRRNEVAQFEVETLRAHLKSFKTAVEQHKRHAQAITVESQDPHCPKAQAEKTASDLAGAINQDEERLRLLNDHVVHSEKYFNAQLAQMTLVALDGLVTWWIRRNNTSIDDVTRLTPEGEELNRVYNSFKSPVFSATQLLAHHAQCAMETAHSAAYGVKLGAGLTALNNARFGLIVAQLMRDALRFCERHGKHRPQNPADLNRFERVGNMVDNYVFPAANLTTSLATLLLNPRNFSAGLLAFAPEQLLSFPEIRAWLLQVDPRHSYAHQRFTLGLALTHQREGGGYVGFVARAAGNLNVYSEPFARGFRRAAKFVGMSDENASGFFKFLAKVNAAMPSVKMVLLTFRVASLIDSFRYAYGEQGLQKWCQYFSIWLLNSYAKDSQNLNSISPQQRIKFYRSAKESARYLLDRIVDDPQASFQFRHYLRKLYVEALLMEYLVPSCQIGQAMEAVTSLFDAAAHYCGISGFDLRKQVVQFERANQANLIQKKLLKADSVAVHIEKLEKGTIFSTEAELYALAKVLERPIIVLGDRVNLAEAIAKLPYKLTDLPGEPIYLLYDAANKRYAAILLRGENFFDFAYLRYLEQSSRSLPAKSSAQYASEAQARDQALVAAYADAQRSVDQCLELSAGVIQRHAKLAHHARKVLAEAADLTRELKGHGIFTPKPSSARPLDPLAVLAESARLSKKSVAAAGLFGGKFAKKSEKVLAQQSASSVRRAASN